jgi:hypothetical protein
MRLRSALHPLQIPLIHRSIIESRRVESPTGPKLGPEEHPRPSTIEFVQNERLCRRENENVGSGVLLIGSIAAQSAFFFALND